MAKRSDKRGIDAANENLAPQKTKRAKKGSGARTSKGIRNRTEIGLSKGLNKGGATGVTRRGEPKARGPR